MADTGEKVYIAKESTSQEILQRIGADGNATVIGKLNSPKVIKSVQRGVATFTNTLNTRVVVDIAPVNTAKSFINVQPGLVYQRDGTNNSIPMTVAERYFGAPNAGRLISSTQIELIHQYYTDGSSGGTMYIWWEVVEFY